MPKWPTGYIHIDRYYYSTYLIYICLTHSMKKEKMLNRLSTNCSVLGTEFQDDVLRTQVGINVRLVAFGLILGCPTK